jgi:hypothetical protein
MVSQATGLNASKTSQRGLVGLNQPQALVRGGELGMNTEPDTGDGKGFLRVGDVILLTFDEKLWDELDAGAAIKTEGGATGKAGVNVEELQEKGSANDNLKAHITRKPDLEYKGVFYCMSFIPSVT